MREEAAKPGFRDRAASALIELRRALPRELQAELAGVLSEEGIDALVADGMAGVMARLGEG